MATRGRAGPGEAPSIFISYRRSNAFVVDRLHEKFSAVFTAGSVFLDRMDIEPGAKFPDRLKDGVEAATIVVVVIGRDWISVQDPKTFRRRLDIPGDWVRQEIEIALARDKILIPVLIEGADMPTAEQLPDSLAALSDCNAIAISREHFPEDVTKLVEVIGTRLGEDRARKLLKDDKTRYPKPAEAALTPSALSEEQLLELPRVLPQWRIEKSILDDDPRFGPGYIRIEMARDFRFDSFMAAIDFMHAVALQIDAIGHHPRWENVFQTVTVRYSTWDVGHRPSDRDIKCAGMLEKLYARFISTRVQ